MSVRGRKAEDRKQLAESKKGVSDTTARGVIAMMALVFVFQAVTFIIHKCSGNETPAYDYSLSQDKSREGYSSHRYPSYNNTFSKGKRWNNGRRKRQLFLFDFDPNTIGIDSLQLLGFSYKQAQTIIHYREKGGRFRKKEDFSKMYTVSTQKYEELAPYIVIRSNATASQATRSHTPDSTPRKHTNDSRHSEDNGEEKISDGKTKNKSSGWSNKRERVYVDLNEADSAALVSVSGIGPYFCKAILSYRKRLGSFASIDQLLEIKGMDQEKYDRIKDQVFVHPAGIKRFSIAEADENFLKRHPYIGAYNARGIALFIQSQGKERCTLKALYENNILSPEDTLRLHPYMK